MYVPLNLKKTSHTLHCRFILKICDTILVDQVTHEFNKDTTATYSPIPEQGSVSSIPKNAAESFAL